MPEHKETGKEEEVRKGARNYLKYSGMAFQMIGVMLGFILGGSWLDGYLDTSPLFIIVGSLVGVAGGLYLALKDFL